MRRINIYYGGRGLIEDPTIYVIKKITKVLKELNIDIKRYNLYEDKHGISILPKTLKEADAVILAASVEWFGIGGLMHQFLDACWLYGNKDILRSLYMMPVALATTYGEKEAITTLTKAWEMLGGIPCDGICAYVADHGEFETNPDYAFLIEKQTENFYRTITKKYKTFPSSTNTVQESTLQTKSISLTPQESEQLSMYVSNDSYVKKQKEDIEELTQMFQGMLGSEEDTTLKDPYLSAFQSHFHPTSGINRIFTIEIQDLDKTIQLAISGTDLECSYNLTEHADIAAKTTKETLEKIINGEMTLQGAFLSGELSAMGDFKILRSFDSIFRFRT